jgi:hypothetical protein
LLLFTEHKDTLDYLAGDGKDNRPLGKLREWGLSVTQIHGGMKIGDRDTPHTRIYAEREFKEQAQVLVATEAAGEGINLQFCHMNELNLAAIIGKSVEARERRLVPEMIEDFFIQAAPIAGVDPKPVAKGGHVYRVGKVPRPLMPIGQRLEITISTQKRSVQPTLRAGTHCRVPSRSGHCGHALCKTTRGSILTIKPMIQDRMTWA